MLCYTNKTECHRQTEKERETERCSQGNSQQTDRRIWVPGNALHSSAHLDRLHTTRRTDLPESDRAIITSCEQGGERLQSRPHSMNPSKGCMFYLNITFKLGFQEVLWPQHRKLKEKKIKMNMEFKKNLKNPKQVVFRKNFKDRVVKSIIMDTLWQYSRSLQNTDSWIKYLFPDTNSKTTGLRLSNKYTKESVNG